MRRGEPAARAEWRSSGQHRLRVEYGVKYFPAASIWGNKYQAPLRPHFRSIEALRQYATTEFGPHMEPSENPSWICWISSGVNLWKLSLEERLASTFVLCTKSPLQPANNKSDDQKKRTQESDYGAYWVRCELGF